MATASPAEPFAGWTPSDVGCHWSRHLPDGRTAHLSTYSSGEESGYTLTVDYATTTYPDLDAANAAFTSLAPQSS
jgi:hypothetical protein